MKCFRRNWKESGGWGWYLVRGLEQKKMEMVLKQNLAE